MHAECTRDLAMRDLAIWRRWAERFGFSIFCVLGCDLGFGLDGAPLNLRSCAFLEIMGTFSFAPYWSIFGAKKGVTGAHLLHFRSSLVIWDGENDGAL